MMRRYAALAAALALLACSVSAAAQSDTDTAAASQESAIITATDPAATAAPQATPAAEPYEVTTLLSQATFPSKPYIEVYNYLLGDSVCSLAIYDLEYDDGEMYLAALTFPDELQQAIADMDDEARASILHMTLDVPESLGFVVDAGEATALFDNQCCTFAAYDSAREFAGWAVMDSRQVVFTFATGDDSGVDYLAGIKTRRALEFAVDGRQVSFGGVAMNFPYSVSVEGSAAVSENAVTYEWAEIIQLSDVTVLTGAGDSDAQSEALAAWVPAGAVDVSTQTLDSTLTMLYSYDNAGLNRPMQGRLIMLDGCILRMEGSFDDAGDAFMDDVYIG